MNIVKLIVTTAFAVVLPIIVVADVFFREKASIKVTVNAAEAQVVHTALEIFSRDYKKVFDANVVSSVEGQILIGTLGMGAKAEQLVDRPYVDSLGLHPEAYVIQVKNDKIIILGSDKRGTAYGILELSRRMGVSPWEWWADSKIDKKQFVKFADGFNLFQYPSVKYRGIFLNDEDWGLNPWSYLTHEPSTVKGQIGPKTHARIFELLLRLRANAFWPAMHEVSEAFYVTPGNKEIADKYGIVVGTSHCEPMMRNANTEWKREGIGNYDYVNNGASVLKFWEERVKQLKNADNIYTLGIRGVHDGKMQGANTLQEQKDAIANIIKDQRQMIAKNLNSDVTKIPQVFIPYKEVLDVYNMGLKVPDDVTLVWTDDNYGYIRHLPNEKERLRAGGHGMYYHISYWGRPHDHLWLSTTHPAQVFTQMKTAYDKGVRDLWILNVGDIKPGEYLTELFLDMAWDINEIPRTKNGLDAHLQTWLVREFGLAHSKELLAVMNEYYRLAYIRKPEFMGNTRTEEKDPKFGIVTDLPWSESEIKKRIEAYNAIENNVIRISKTITANKREAWFELIEYPIRGAAALNKKLLYAQLARHGKANWSESDNAFDTITVLTDKYNALAGGKWKHIMSANPRKQAVFQKVERKVAEGPLLNPKQPLVLLNGNSYTKFIGIKPTHFGLGYQSAAIHLEKNSTVTYSFENASLDSVWVEVTLAPNHPVDGDKIRFAIRMDEGAEQVIDYHTVDRNEEWKQNVLTNQAIRITKFKVRKSTTGSRVHTITLKAIDEGVIIDQLKVWEQAPFRSHPAPSH